MKVECELCHKIIKDTDALINTTSTGEKRIICQRCFQKQVGVDYATFNYRKKNAKSLAIAVIICLIGTIYAFVEKGFWYGGLGIALTILVYLFSFKLKK